MARPRILPDAPELAKLRREGKTYEDIATMYGVTKAAVHVALERSHLIETPRPRYIAEIPWRVKGEHSSEWALVQLRRAARRDAGTALSAREERMLDAWIGRLREQDAVVAYDPDRERGFYYVRRRPGVDLGLIHEPSWVLEEEPPRARKRA
jgi:hypothetical protein